MNAAFCRMQETEVLHGVDDPEVLIASSDFDDLFRRRDLNHGGVAQLGANTNDVVGVVLDHASGALGCGTHCSRQKQD